MKESTEPMGMIHTPELSRLLSKFEQLNVETQELVNEIYNRLNALKAVSPEVKSEEIKGVDPYDICSHLEQQLGNLEQSNNKLKQIFQHIQTII